MSLGEADIRRLARLEEIAANLYYSWDRPARALFAKLGLKPA